MGAFPGESWARSPAEETVGCLSLWAQGQDLQGGYYFGTHLESLVASLAYLG